MSSASPGELSQILKDYRAYESDKLGREVASDAWLHMQPNYRTDSDALPRHLDAERIEIVFATLLSDPVISAAAKQGIRDTGNIAQHIRRRALLPGGVPGSQDYLEYIGHGESKIAYLLTLQEAGRMAVVFTTGYDRSLGLQVPADSRMSRIVSAHSRPERPLWEYSDFRCYMYLPVCGVGYGAIKLQEYGGTSGGFVFPGARAMARSRLHRYLRTTNIPGFSGTPKIDEAELRHAKHYLRKPWRLPGLIDVPVIERRDRGRTA